MTCGSMVYILLGTLYICTYVHRYSYACTLHVVVHLYRVDRYTRHATIHTAYGYVDTVLSTLHGTGSVSYTCATHVLLYALKELYQYGVRWQHSYSGVVPVGCLVLYVVLLYLLGQSAIIHRDDACGVHHRRSTLYITSCLCVIPVHASIGCY